MNAVDKARKTQSKNIEAKTGRSLAEPAQIINESSLTKHSELRDMVREEFGLGYGDANALVHLAKEAAVPAPSTADMDAVTASLEAIYSGSKVDLRALHEAVMTHVRELGDFEIAPKKTYWSLRRQKQFATVGPASKGRVEIGLNMKDVAPTGRLESLPPGRMCQYRIYLSEPAEIDSELLGWIATAYGSAA